MFFIVMNYEEEEWGRDSWGHVAVWAVTHLVMGIPVFAVAAIFSVGVVYKQIHDRYGFDEAYAAHVATNTSLVIGLAAISITLSVIG
ncbi:hypothetical protein DJ70_08020 [Halorubrum halodurans]|uniref:Uncharacterized protein n=1 Tax=Halorubrum halodurans TaxID=1383851 RepID=A0A256IKG5_9EURY|nr:hypothetical protein DJ70_08020 [Halorubrum halodurans]